jgi:hypothetical protein
MTNILSRHPVDDMSYTTNCFPPEFKLSVENANHFHNNSTPLMCYFILSRDWLQPNNAMRCEKWMTITTEMFISKASPNRFDPVIVVVFHQGFQSFECLKGFNFGWNNIYIYIQRKQETSSMKVRRYLAPPSEGVVVGPQISL